MSLGSQVLAPTIAILLCLSPMAKGTKNEPEDDVPESSYQNSIVWVVSAVSAALIGIVGYTDWVIGPTKKEADKPEKKTHKHRRSQFSWVASSPEISFGSSSEGSFFLRSSPTFEPMIERAIPRINLRTLEMLTLTLLSDDDNAMELRMMPQLKTLELSDEHGEVIYDKKVFRRAVIEQLIRAHETGYTAELGFHARHILKKLQEEGFNLLPN